MAIVEYSPELFQDLQEMVARVPRNMNLTHRPFVDYFYASSEYCKLYLFLSDSGRVLGTFGRQLLHFENQGREITVRIGSNWFSCKPGVGGLLSKHAALANPNTYAMTFVVSREALQVLDHYHWISISGVNGYFLNGCSLRPWDAWWKVAANSIARQMGGRRIKSLTAQIPHEASARITICEEHSYSSDLLPQRSPFRFRLAPTVEFLNWRYSLALSFVRYRLFRVIAAGATVGYVILNESPQQIIVAQCDGEDATMLAFGILMAIAQVGGEDRRPRTVFLSCCHAEMQKVFEAGGLSRWLRGNLPFGFRTLPPDLDLSSGISTWLVNYDWSDNGLQAPFLDQDVAG